MAYVIDDLGIVARGNAWMSWKYAKHPKTGEEFALAGMSKAGFLLINPKTRKSIHVGNSQPDSECWAVAQAPGGAIYAGLYGSGEVLRWDWEGDTAEVVGKIPGTSLFGLDAAADGRVYLPDYGRNRLMRYDHSTRRIENCGDFNDMGEHIHNVYCGPDGLVYGLCYTYGAPTVVAAFDPATGRKRKVSPPAGAIKKDAGGRLLSTFSRYGRTHYAELVNGELRPIAQDQVRLGPGGLPLAFEDGSYLTVPYREEVFDDHRKMTYVDAGGKTHPFEAERPEMPLRLFTVESGAGRLWCGTFIPLRLASYEPATGKSEHLGNPAHATGEIYSMVFTAGKLYMASYTSAPVTRYIPDKPWRKDDGIYANPAHLGYMKEEGPKLHRPYGKALDAKGRVFFAARGDYGCFDSGVSRIEPATEEMTRWIYPETTFGAMAYSKATEELLVAERKRNEKALRMTRISPDDGRVIDSHMVIDDDGEIASLLDSGGDLIYGLHAYRATIFAYSQRERKIVAVLREMRFGEHCHNALLIGFDGRIWGYTDRAIFAVSLDLKHAEEVVSYHDIASEETYRFGICYGPDGAIYFPNGARLMRVKKAD